MSAITNLARACIGVVAAPAMIVADVLTLPSSAYDGRPAFGRTAKTISAAGACFDEAMKPESKGPK